MPRPAFVYTRTCCLPQQHASGAYADAPWSCRPARDGALASPCTHQDLCCLPPCAPHCRWRLVPGWPACTNAHKQGGGLQQG
eukprot:1139379-Pelagomonas_calceolata.AAC.5